MKLDYASAYCDESRNTFLRRVDLGVYPAGTPLGGNRYWFREDLDESLDKLRETKGPLDPTGTEPFWDVFDGVPKGETPQ